MEPQLTASSFTHSVVVRVTKRSRNSYVHILGHLIKENLEMEIKKIGYCFKAKLFALVSGNFRLKLFFNISPIKFRQRKWICIKTGLSGGVRTSHMLSRHGAPTNRIQLYIVRVTKSLRKIIDPIWGKMSANY